MLSRVRRGAVAASTVLGIGLAGQFLVAAPAAAATTYSARGVEIAATSTEGTFVGAVNGPARSTGLFEATVDHNPVPTASGVSSAITGGTLWLRTWSPSAGGETVSGTFTDGTITLERAGADCTNQTFSVAGEVTTNDGGTGEFDVTLTHYRIRLFGSCLTYGATVKGTLSTS